MNVRENINGAIYSHTAWARGYVSRKNPNGEIMPYSGRYGVGYAVLRPSWRSTNFCHKDYYIYEEATK